LHAFTLRDGSRLIALHDGVFEPDVDILVDLAGEAETAALKLAAAPLRLDVNAYALERDGRVVLIDAGAGGAWGPKFGRVAQALEALGIQAEAIETVLLTHPHGDHALGLIGADGSARYRNATVFCPGIDIAHFTSDAAREAAGPAKAQGFEMARSVFSVVGDRLRAFEAGEVLPGVEAVSLPGHTPGHSGFLIGGQAFVWGDVMHLADRQPQRPTVGTVFDNDPALALQTRRQAMSMAAEGPLDVFGMHTPFGRRGRVVVDGDVFSMSFDAV
jgi:glyoxylase-like metal-dependent hydrolase (beta-lactamase superfamily II)